MISSPFTANKKWLADKWVDLAMREMQQGEKWQVRQYVQMDKLLEAYPHYQIFVAMLEYFKIAKQEKDRAEWFDFIKWCGVDGNIPSERMSKLVCLQKHFPKDEKIIEAKRNVRTFEEAWFPSGDVTAAANAVDEIIDGYMRKLV